MAIRRGLGFTLGKKFDAFQDLVIYQNRFTALHTAAFFQLHLHRHFEWPPPAFAYPPATVFLYQAFYRTAYPEAIYVMLAILWCIFSVFGAFKALQLPNLSRLQRCAISVSAPLFSFPFVFLVERANLELFVWMLITVGIFLCIKQRPHAAAVFFGLATSLKLYPVLLLGLFLSRQRRKWTAALTGLFAAIAATLLAIWFTGPTFPIAFHGFFDGIVRFTVEHAETTRLAEAPFDHSLFSLVKSVYFFRKGSPLQWTHLYYLLAGSAAFLLFCTRVRMLPFVNRLVLLSVAMILLPPVSYEYTIVHLYLPFILFAVSLLRAASRPQTRVPDSYLWALGCFLFAMLPLGIMDNGGFLYAGNLQTFALLGVAAASLVSPWQLDSVSYPVDSASR